MKKLSDILEGILGDISTDLDKNFPSEIAEIVNLWKKVKLKKFDLHLLRAEPYSRSFNVERDVYQRSMQLLEKVDCERVIQSSAQNLLKQDADNVIITMGGKDPKHGIYICYAKTKECVHIYDDVAAIFVRKVHSINLWHVITKNPSRYMILPGACWEPLKNVLQP